ncbi:MAG: hypothetical protein H6Q00_2369 [Holophagaceae bacterium]|nr:hypothetical protein [Holophagaceae bacterium]
MILQALCEYYERKGDLAPDGFARVEIPFLIVINMRGEFCALEDTRQTNGRQMRAREFLFPKPLPRSGSKSYQVTHLLWDHIGYIAGQAKSEDPKDRALADAQHHTWLTALGELARKYPEEPGIRAMQSFYSTGQCARLIASSTWSECRKIAGCNMAFRMDGEPDPIPCTHSVHAIAERRLDGEAGPGKGEEVVRHGICLVTGESTKLARIHTRTPISKDSKSLVNFQRNSGYDSYGKEQGFNAPVSTAAEAAYTTALNHLLAKDSKQKMQVGDATTVFWSGRKDSTLEADFPAFFGLAPRDDPDAEARAVSALYGSPHTGYLPKGDDTPFYVLGLAPNAARIAVRFWHVDTVAGQSAKLRQHLDDLDIVRGPLDPGRRALMPLLCDLVLQGKADNVPPNLAGNVVRAVLSGAPYPQTLLHMAIRRIRAERQVTRMRAAVLKAVLNRTHRLQPASSKEITVSLDPTNTCPGYVLGRVFALLERIQLASNNYQEVNAGIRDRFYGAFSSSPCSTYPLLMKLKNHHLRKIERKGEAVNLERLLGEVTDLLPAQGPKPHLSLDEQARFAIGYYHQRQALFTKSPKSETPDQA